MSEQTNSEIVKELGDRAAAAHAELGAVLDMVTAYRADGGDFLWPNGVRGNLIDAMDCLAIIFQACP